MTPEQLTKLKDGDIIRQLSSGNAYTVLRNTGPVVIAARTLEVTSAHDWEHVYTTAPVKEPSPTVFEMIDALEGCGWTYDATRCHGWIAPDGFAETSLHRAYELRNEHHRTTRPLVEKGPRPYPGGQVGHNELVEAGWNWVSPNVWKSPCGALRGGREWAWRIMDNAKIAACTAAGAPPVKSYQEARAALCAAGWRNVYGKVWRSPSGAHFDGASSAYDAMKKIPPTGKIHPGHTLLSEIYV